MIDLKTMKLLVSLIVIVATLGCCLGGSHLHMRHIDIHPDYNIHEAPRGEHGKPLNVDFSINVRNVLGVNEREQILSMETSLRMYWRDPR